MAAIPKSTESPLESPRAPLPIPVFPPAPNNPTAVAQSSLAALPRQGSSPDLNPDRVSVSDPPQEKFLSAGENNFLLIFANSQERDAAFREIKESSVSVNQLLTDPFLTLKLLLRLEKLSLEHTLFIDSHWCPYTSDQKLELLELCRQRYQLLRDAVFATLPHTPRHRIISITERRLSAIETRIHALKNLPSKTYFVDDHREPGFNKLKALLDQSHQELMSIHNAGDLKNKDLPEIKKLFIESSISIETSLDLFPAQKIELWELLLNIIKWFHTTLRSENIPLDLKEVLSLQAQIESKLEPLKKHPIPTLDPFPADLFSLELGTTYSLPPLVAGLSFGFYHALNAKQ